MTEKQTIWNPLDEIRIFTYNEAKDARRVVDELFLPENDWAWDYLKEEARNLLIALALHVRYIGSDKASFAGMCDLLCGHADDDEDRVLKEMLNYEHDPEMKMMWKDTFEHLSKTHPLVARTAESMLRKEYKERMPIYGTAIAILQPYWLQQETSMIDQTARLTNQQALAMLKLQNDMNCKVNPEWLAAGYPFLRAVVIEGAEAIEHKGWKWWKAQMSDLPQLQMELIDIWHFMLSDYVINAEGNIDVAANKINADFGSHAALIGAISFDGKYYELAKIDLLRKLELIIGLAAARRVSIPLFASVLADCDMTWDDLYRQYIAKNVLNFFRQDHGYKTGGYRKIWDGREDNEHLVELMAAGEGSEGDFAENLYQRLKARYESLGEPVH